MIVIRRLEKKKLILKAIAYVQIILFSGCCLNFKLWDNGVVVVVFA
jgi:hypothetical protein